MISQTATFETLEFSKNSICTASKSIVADIKQWEQETMYKILSVKSKSANLSKQVETAHEKIVKCKHIIEENRRKHQEALEDIQDRIFKLVKDLEETETQLKKKVILSQKAASKVKRATMSIPIKIEKRKNLEDTIRVCKRLTNISFDYSVKDVVGLVHNEISNDYKPFKFQTEEGEQEVCEKMWKTLEKASGETFVNLMNQLEIQD